MNVRQIVPCHNILLLKFIDLLHGNVHRKSIYILKKEIKVVELNNNELRSSLCCHTSRTFCQSSL